MAELREMVLDRVAIEDLVGQYVSLKPAGREFKACCPFHEEKTPSFTVSPERGFFYCFGCQAGGNAIDFVMRMENLEFRDAMEWLANRYSIEIPKYSGQGQQKGEKQRLYEINEAALKYFLKSLEGPGAAQAQKYIAGRGVSPAQAREFDLGYAPAEWQGLTDTLLSHGAKSAELLTLGLIKERREAAPGADSQAHRFYDSFRNRLIFPIRQVTGRVIGFAGRALSEEDQPKYLNVTNTPLYDKSKVLYHLDRAKGLAREEGLVVVEGYMDVIGLAAGGVHNTVATCGTALTIEHIKLLTRYAERFYLAFDGDRAGREAAWTAGKLFLQQGLDVRVVPLPAGVDPDEFIRRDGLEAWNALIGGAVSVVRFWLNHQLSANPDGDVVFRQRLVTQLAGLYRLVPDELLRQSFRQEVASALMMRGDEVAGLLGGRAALPAGNRNIRAQLREQAQRGALLQGTEPIEREVIRRLVTDDELLHSYRMLAEPEWFGVAEYRRAFELIRDAENLGQLVKAEPLARLLVPILAAEPLRDSNELLLQRHRNNYLEQQVSRLQTAWEAAVRSGNDERERELRTEILDLKSQIKSIRSVLI